MSRDPMNPFDDREFQKTGSDVKDRVSDLTSKVKDKASQVADSVSDKMGQQRENAAESLNRAATTIHNRAERVPGGPRAVNLTHSLADGMESTASYLRDHDFGQMGKDIMSICRRYPTQSVFAALALGFFIGRSRR